MQKRESRNAPVKKRFTVSVTEQQYDALVKFAASGIIAPTPAEVASFLIIEGLLKYSGSLKSNDKVN